MDFPKVLRPGGSGSIKVKVETGKSPGPHTKSVTIKTNDPEEPSVIVHLKFDVKDS
ncbi:MAG TPA: hypothetical protein VNN73_05350 [Blastocatellia bacterium]|nr:hypothetical protein [Blastocatellia bacterium]